MWHVSPGGDRWSRMWGEEHFGNGKVHKYGKSTIGESWDIVVDEETYYEAEPHYGWADVVGDSSQLLSIQSKLVALIYVFCVKQKYLSSSPTTILVISDGNGSGAPISISISI